MPTHAFAVETKMHGNPATGKPTGAISYRWACSCHRVGPWRTGGVASVSLGKAARSARIGGGRHVAAMERG